MGTIREMPKYKCHKEVRALKIKDVLTSWTGQKEGSAYLTFEEEGYLPHEVSREYFEKHEPRPGGYYVVYEDGYESWSPAEPFEAGYALI